MSCRSFAGAITLLVPLLVSDAADLQIFSAEYPRAFFFRACESVPFRKGMTYERWAAEFGRLAGIIGKCLDEEIVGREVRNPEWFARFKRDHPHQVVLLHFNGNARDPRYRATKYFAGHWIYRKATRILSDVPAESGETIIRVEDASDFRVNTGRYRTSNDDVALFAIGQDGKHDWYHCEQVQLVSVNKKNNTIVVRRGCYGTTPLAFKAGKARAAAHQVEGPWGQTNNLLWFYNFATHCPKDSDGRTCADRLVDEFAEWFGKGGKLEAFDGVEFDVLFNDTRGDTDGDGLPDDGIINGINQYGIGVVEFLRQLRRRLGSHRIIQADGALGSGGRRSQRAFGILNGIESEGWPNLNDWDFDDWSGGLNRLNFWQQNARKPVFNYINHKWTEPVPEKPGFIRNPQVPFARHRLVFAAAQFVDAMLCYSFAPPNERGAQIGIWDELVCGTVNKPGWLGKPEGEAVHMAAAMPNRLPAMSTLAKKITGAVNLCQIGDDIVISPTSAEERNLTFSIPGIATSGETDLVVFLTMKGAPRKAYPAEMARLVEVGIAETGAATSPPATVPATRAKTTARGQKNGAPRFYMTWLNDRFFTSVFYFRNVRAWNVDLVFRIEGTEPVTIRSVTAHAHPDAMYRLFENGLVLANPSLAPYTFDLGKISPGRPYRRIRATPLQDTATNNGQQVGGQITVGPVDALFLLRTK